MADFVQTRFLGASVTNFNASLGWSNQASQLNVSLVEDDVVGDKFTPKDIGSPVQFNFQGWIFNGLLQSWKRNDNQGGSPTYEVSLVDPREILEGVQVIIADYPNSTHGMFNLLNVYGYYESFGFGNSDVNEAGMSWYNIQQGVQTLTALGSSSTYGTSIRFNQSSYSLNLTALPQLPYYYRVGGTNVSIMDFIIDICEAGGCDFFFRMVATDANTFVIQLEVVNRRVLPQLGQIARFIGNQGNVENSNYGYELLNSNTGKFVVGGAIEEINLNFISLDRMTIREAKAEEVLKFNQEILTNDGLDDTDNIRYHYYDGNIWPFWGFNAVGNAILGQGNPYSNGHYFILDSRSVELAGVGAFYPTDVGEMRASLDSYESWMFYLEIKDRDSESPAFGRYSQLGGVSPLKNNIAALLTGAILSQDADNPDVGALKKIPWAHLAVLTGRQRKLAAATQGGNDILESLMKLYDFVRSYASQFYGHKYMVRVPYIYTKIESETLRQTLSQEPVSDGFVPEDEWIDAIAKNFLPFDINRLTTEEGKIEAYVRYDNFEWLDLSGLSADDYIVSENLQSVFIKCNVESTLVYIDRETYYSPRAVITLAGPVRIQLRFGDQKQFSGQIIDTLNILLNKNFPNISQQEKNQAIKDAINTWSSQGASESIFLSSPGKALPPILVGLPLRSNIVTYGPWYVQGASGKIDFEKDDSLVPWHYGGYEVMNSVAEAKIVAALTNQLISETGTLEFPGVPEISLGSALIAGGPFVTDINVSIGHEGARTQYRMQLAPRFGKFAKANVDRLTRISKAQQMVRRNIREFNRELPFNHPIFKIRESFDALGHYHKPKQVTHASSHLLIQAECLLKDKAEDSDPDTYHINACVQPTYNFLNQSYDEYERKGIMSIDGLMVPFSTDTSVTTGIPHYEELGDVSDDDITRDDLSRYEENHGISQIARDSNIDDDDTLYEADGYSEDNIYRGIALRGPIMIAGPGYDTEGKPVPADDEDEDAFIDNVHQRPDMWKVGPLDARWDDDKKVWVAGGATDIKIGVLSSNIRAATRTGSIDEDGHLYYNKFFGKSFYIKPINSYDDNYMGVPNSTQLKCMNPYPNLSVDISASGVTIITVAKYGKHYTPISVDCSYG